jgi:putative ABC transport system permease protein
MLMRLMPVEGIRFPVIVSISSFAIAILVVLIDGVIIALLIYRRIKRLDMIAVLKTRE